MKSLKLFLFSMSVVLLSLVSCSDGSNGSGAGTLSIKMTDAPFPHDMVKAANVTIFKIDARKKSDDGEAETSAEFVTLSETETTLNLLELTNGITATLANAEVPEGSYDLVRLFVSEASIELSDGTMHTVKVPSGSQTGIKVFVKPSILVAGGLTADLLLDFDVSSSFVLNGNLNMPSGITGFIFKPTIKASNISTSGTLSGTVSELSSDPITFLEEVEISVYASDTLNTTTFTDLNGAYTVLGLSAGSYKVEAELEGFVSKEVENVTIVAGNKSTVNFELEPNL
ncbi:MAG: DUF4382 domain-containing protein [Flavobacteriaceae bacterium]|nr:DUF4382 domain-containing protein [Flavobacteriaceae bacterium]